jgi:hypothetical protein
MEFFTSSPAKAINPINARNHKELPVIQSAINAPIRPIGMTDKTIKVLLNVLNSRTKIAMNKNKVIIRMVPNPPNV